MDLSKVYIVQEQNRWDEKAMKLVPRFDLSSAEQYGDLDYLLSPTAAPFSSASILRDLHHKLRHFTDEDYLLLIGNPCLIGWSVAVASYHNDGFVTLLQWSGREGKYIEIKSEILKGEEDDR